MIGKDKQSIDMIHIQTRLYSSHWSTVFPEFDTRCTSSTVYEDELVSSNEEKDGNRRTNIFDSLTIRFDAQIRQPGHTNKVIGQHNFSSEHQHGCEAHARDDDNKA